MTPFPHIGTPLAGTPTGAAFPAHLLLYFRAVREVVCCDTPNDVRVVFASAKIRQMPSCFPAFRFIDLFAGWAASTRR